MPEIRLWNFYPATGPKVEILPIDKNEFIQSSNGFGRSFRVVFWRLSDISYPGGYRKKRRPVHRKWVHISVHTKPFCVERLTNLCTFSKFTCIYNRKHVLVNSSSPENSNANFLTIVCLFAITSRFAHFQLLQKLPNFIKRFLWVSHILQPVSRVW